MNGRQHNQQSKMLSANGSQQKKPLDAAAGYEEAYKEREGMGAGSLGFLDLLSLDQLLMSQPQPGYPARAEYGHGLEPLPSLHFHDESMLRSGPCRTSGGIAEVDDLFFPRLSRSSQSHSLVGCQSQGFFPEYNGNPGFEGGAGLAMPPATSTSFNTPSLIHSASLPATPGKSPPAGGVPACAGLVPLTDHSQAVYPSINQTINSQSNAVNAYHTSQSTGFACGHFQRIPAKKRKEYKCTFPQCDRVFPRLYNLKSHLLVHTGEKPHACSYCGTAFGRKHDLQRHIRTLHIGKKEKCNECGKEFGRIEQLRKHQCIVSLATTIDPVTGLPTLPSVESPYFTEEQQHQQQQQHFIENSLGISGLIDPVLLSQENDCLPHGSHPAFQY